MCTMCTWSSSKILMHGEIDSFYFKWYTLSTSVKPCSLQSDLRFPSALKSSAYLKLTSLLVWSQKMSSLKISQITTCRAHVQLAPWLLKFRSCPDESDIFETAVQSGLKAPSTRIWEKNKRFQKCPDSQCTGPSFSQKTYYCADINNKTYIAPISITKLILRRYQ